jgi:hypothetical protein
MYGQRLYDGDRPAKAPIIYSTAAGEVMVSDRLEVLSPSEKWRVCTVVGLKTKDLQIHYEGFARTFAGAVEWIPRNSRRFNQTGVSQVNLGLLDVTRSVHGGESKIPKANVFQDMLASWEEMQMDSEWQGWWAPPGQKRQPRRKKVAADRPPSGRGVKASVVSTSVETLAGRALLQQLTSPFASPRKASAQSFSSLHEVGGWSFMANYRDKMQDKLATKAMMKDMLICWKAASITNAFHVWKEATLASQTTVASPPRGDARLLATHPSFYGAKNLKKKVGHTNHGHSHSSGLKRVATSEPGSGGEGATETLFQADTSRESIPTFEVGPQSPLPGIRMDTNNTKPLTVHLQR